MAHFAVIENNIVTNVIVADDKEQSEKDLGVELVEVTSENPGGIGWGFDSTTGKFIEPVMEEIDNGM